MNVWTLHWRIKTPNLLEVYAQHKQSLLERDPNPVRRNGRLPSNKKNRVTVDLFGMDEATRNDFFDWFYIETPFRGQYALLWDTWYGSSTLVFRHAEDAVLVRLTWAEHAS